MASSAELLTPYYATLAPTLIAQTTKYLGSNWDEGTRVLEHAIISVANKGGEGRELLNGVIKTLSHDELQSTFSPNNNTPLHLALALNDPLVIQMLIENGAANETKNRNGVRPIDIPMATDVMTTLKSSLLANARSTPRLRTTVQPLRMKQKSEVDIAPGLVSNNVFLRANSVKALEPSQRPRLGRTTEPASNFSSLKNVFESVIANEESESERTLVKEKDHDEDRVPASPPMLAVPSAQPIITAPKPNLALREPKAPTSTPVQKEQDEVPKQSELQKEVVVILRENQESEVQQSNVPKLDELAALQAGMLNQPKIVTQATEVIQIPIEVPVVKFDSEEPEVQASFKEVMEGPIEIASIERTEVIEVPEEIAPTEPTEVIEVTEEIAPIEVVKAPEAVETPIEQKASVDPIPEDTSQHSDEFAFPRRRKQKHLFPVDLPTLSGTPTLPRRSTVSGPRNPRQTPAIEFQIENKRLSPARSLTSSMITYSPSLRLNDGDTVRPASAIANAKRGVSFGKAWKGDLETTSRSRSPANEVHGKFMFRLGRLEQLNLSQLPFQAWVFVTIQCGKQVYQSRLVKVDRPLNFEQEFAFEATLASSLHAFMYLRVKAPVAPVHSTGKHQASNLLQNFFKKDRPPFEVKETVDAMLGQYNFRVNDLLEGQDVTEKTVTWDNVRSHEWPQSLLQSGFKVSNLGQLLLKAGFVETNNAFDNLSSLADIEEKHALEKRFWKEGYMSQIGGDLWLWKRRYYRLIGLNLHAYHESYPSVHGNEAQEPLYYTSLYLPSLVAKPTILSHADHAHDSEYPVPHSFRLDFKGDERVNFYCDTREDAEDWCRITGRIFDLVQAGKHRGLSSPSA